MRSEVRIGPQSLSYRFQNEIMDHPCSDWGPGSDRIECTKFNKGCTQFFKDVPNVVNDVLRVKSVFRGGN